ncbi:MAG: hypothetical protein LUG18_03050 [Candidatus Azobacteroides sp.]|nr:hypothetical protein [Candidatus Azobacteroides sp.]
MAKYIFIIFLLSLLFSNGSIQAQNVDILPEEEESNDFFPEFHWEEIYESWIFLGTDWDILSPEGKRYYVQELVFKTRVMEWEYERWKESASPEKIKEYEEINRKYQEEIDALQEEFFPYIRNSMQGFNTLGPAKEETDEIFGIYTDSKTGNKPVEERLDRLEQFYNEVYAKLESLDRMKKEHPLYLQIWEYEVTSLKKEMQHFTVKQQTRFVSLLNKIAEKKEELE